MKTTKAKVTAPDVRRVAKDLKLNPTPKQISEVLKAYPDAQADAPTDNWSAVIEELLQRIVNPAKQFEQGELNTPEAHAINSLIMEKASDTAHELTKLECQIKGLKFEIVRKEETRYTEAAQDIFNKYYDREMESVYELLNAQLKEIAPVKTKILVEVGGGTVERVCASNPNVKIVVLDKDQRDIGESGAKFLTDILPAESVSENIYELFSTNEPQEIEIREELKRRKF